MKIFLDESNWQGANIGSSNGLALDRWQAITRTNDGLMQWRSLSYSILSRRSQNHHIFLFALFSCLKKCSIFALYPWVVFSIYVVLTLSIQIKSMHLFVFAQYP